MKKLSQRAQRRREHREGQWKLRKDLETLSGLEYPAAKLVQGSRVNAYQCMRCSALLVTRDLHEGTTPMSILCPTCGGGRAYSFGYNKEHCAKLTPTHEWYVPERGDIKSHEQLSYVLKGGLLIRKIVASK